MPWRPDETREQWEARVQASVHSIKRATSDTHKLLREKTASAEFGERLRAALGGLHMAPEAMVAEHEFHPLVDIEQGSCGVCGCAAPELTKPMRAIGGWTRRWAFDFAFPCQRLAIEIEGQGRHQRYTGFRDDCAKYNSACAHGWRGPLRFVAAERKHMQDWVDLTLAVLSGAR